MQDKEEKIVELINGFKGIYILMGLVEYMRYTLNRSSSIPVEGSIARLYLDELRDYFYSKGIVLAYNEIMDLVLEFENTISYAMHDAISLWPILNSGDIRDRVLSSRSAKSLKQLENTHDMPDKILYNYMESMSELNSISKLDIEKLAPYISSKRILDFGCGSCFFFYEFMKLNIIMKTYIGVDRQEILFPVFRSKLKRVERKNNPNVMGRVEKETAEGNLESELMTVEDLDGRMFKTLVGQKIKKFDTIWLSQVIHSKSNPLEFIKSLTKYLKGPNSIILINSVKDYSLLSNFLNVQLAIHTGNTNRNILDTNLGRYIREKITISKQFEIAIIRVGDLND